MLLSIIIPCFNHGEFLHDALESISVIKTDYLYEVIVINDGSTDVETNKIINSLDTSKFIIINQPNQGLAAARNNGIKAAKGKYILPLDCDNKVDVGYLIDSIVILENDSSIDVVYGNPLFFGNESGVKTLGEFNFKRILTTNYIDACAVFRRDMWQKTGGYDGAMPFMGNEDWELWIHMFLQGGKIYYLNKVCFHYRVLSNSMSATTTRPGFTANKEYIYSKHCQGIINYLLPYAVQVENITRFYNENKLRTAAKLLLGKDL